MKKYRHTKDFFFNEDIINPCKNFNDNHGSLYMKKKLSSLFGANFIYPTFSYESADKNTLSSKNTLKVVGNLVVQKTVGKLLTWQL